MLKSDKKKSTLNYLANQSTYNNEIDKLTKIDKVLWLSVFFLSELKVTFQCQNLFSSSLVNVNEIRCKTDCKLFKWMIIYTLLQSTVGL